MHEMTGERDGDQIIWTCPICGRTVRVTRGIPKTEIVGDAFTLHSGGMGGLRMGSITVGELARDDDLTIWREWTGEIGLSSLFDDL